MEKTHKICPSHQAGLQTLIFSLWELVFRAINLSAFPQDFRTPQKHLENSNAQKISHPLAPTENSWVPPKHPPELCLQVPAGNNSPKTQKSGQILPPHSAPSSLSFPITGAKKNISLKNSGWVWRNWEFEGPWRSSGSKANKISILQDWAWVPELEKLLKIQPFFHSWEFQQLNFAIFECRERRLPWAEPEQADLLFFSASHRIFHKKNPVSYMIFF